LGGREGGRVGVREGGRERERERERDLGQMQVRHVSPSLTRFPCAQTAQSTVYLSIA